MSIGLPPLRLSSASEGTHRIVKTAHALLPWRGELAGHDALHPNLLRGADDVLLCVDQPARHSADEDVDALQDLFELLKVVGQLPDADLDPGRLQLLGGGLRDGCRTDEDRDTLQFSMQAIISHCVYVHSSGRHTKLPDLSSPSTMLRPVLPVPPRTRTRGAVVAIECVWCLVC